MAKMKESTKRVITYLQGLDRSENVTAADVADALNMETKSINGVFTAAIHRKGLGERVDAEILLDNGNHKAVKYLKLNDEGYAYDVNALDEDREV